MKWQITGTGLLIYRFCQLVEVKCVVMYLLSNKRTINPRYVQPFSCNHLREVTSRVPANLRNKWIHRIADKLRDSTTGWKENEVISGKRDSGRLLRRPLHRMHIFSDAEFADVIYLILSWRDILFCLNMMYTYIQSTICIYMYIHIYTEYARSIFIIKFL